MDGLQHLVSEFLGSHPEFIASVQWMDTPSGREMMDAKEAGPVRSLLRNAGSVQICTDQLDCDHRDHSSRLSE